MSQVRAMRYEPLCRRAFAMLSMARAMLTVMPKTLRLARGESARQSSREPMPAAIIRSNRYWSLYSGASRSLTSCWRSALLMRISSCLLASP